MAAQIAAIVVFLLMFVLMISETVERHIVTLACGTATLVIVFGLCMRSPAAIVEALSLHSIIRPDFWYQVGTPTTSTGINWETIFFLTGMMIMVDGMSASGFFRWLCMAMAKGVRYRPIPLFFTFMLMSAGLSMFIDSITVILFLAAVTVELAQLLKLDPTPFILAEIFSANLGGSATMCGDPPNIIIGTSLGYSFFDFITNTGFMAILSLPFVVLYCYLYFRRDLHRAAANVPDVAQFPSPASAISNRRNFLLSSLIFLLAVILLITHSQTRLTVSCIGTFIALLTLAAAGKQAGSLLRRLDYKTLLFFIGLFLVVSGLEQAGVLECIASAIRFISGGNAYIVITIILWGSAVASAFIDNIPFAATMIPVIKSLSAAQGIDLQTMAWALSMGTDIGGSATPIGASANVVGTSIAAKNGYPIRWGPYCRAMAPATVLVITISALILFFRYL